MKDYRMTDFNIFWYEYSWHSWPSNDRWSSHLTQRLLLLLPAKNRTSEICTEVNKNVDKFHLSGSVVHHPWPQCARLQCLCKIALPWPLSPPRTPALHRSIGTRGTFWPCRVLARPSPPPSWGTGPPTRKERLKNSAGRLPRRSVCSQPTFML